MKLRFGERNNPSHSSDSESGPCLLENGIRSLVLYHDIGTCHAGPILKGKAALNHIFLLNAVILHRHDGTNYSITNRMIGRARRKRTV